MEAWTENVKHTNLKTHLLYLFLSLETVERSNFVLKYKHIKTERDSNTSKMNEQLSSKIS